MNLRELDSSQWVEKYGDMMIRYTWLRVREEEIAEDIVQTTLLAAFQAKASFLGNSSEKSWLFGILKHKIMDHFREIKKKRTYELLPEDDKNPCDKDFDGKGHWHALPVSWGIDPEKSIENGQLAQVMATCMDTLSDKFRDLFVLKEVEGLSTEEICNELDIKPNNLWVILHRARNQLKKCLEVDWFGKEKNV